MTTGTNSGLEDPVRPVGQGGDNKAPSGRSARQAKSHGFAVWAISILAVLLLDHLFGSYLGLSDRLTDEHGKGRVIFLMIAGSLTIRAMSRGQRPLSYFGLAIENGWQRSFMVAVFLGMSVPGLLYAISYLLGAHAPGPQIATYKYFVAVLAALLAGTIAVYLQEIIYRGFVGTVFYNRLGLWGVVASALVFALTFHFDLSIWRDPQSAVPTMFGMFLAGLILHLARIYHGNLVFPIGLACGWTYVDIFTDRSKLISGQGPNGDLLAIITPNGDIRNSIIIWAIFTATILMYLVLLRRRSTENATDGETQFRQTQTSGLASTFFQGLAMVNPFSNMCLLAPLDVWLRNLWQARFRVHPIYWLRLCMILIISAVSTIVNLPERFLLPLFLKNHTHPDPVFVVGVHRSGTTFLHEILALDPQFVTTRGYHVFNATGFVLIGRFFYFFLGALLPWRRPMDSVEFSLHTPNEDEYAISLFTKCSPYWAFTFPREIAYYDRFIYPDQMTLAERRDWKRALSVFLKKVMLFNSGTPLLKSPYHTSRIELIVELYPNAKFVHIYRNPFDVYRSSMHLQDSLTPLFQLQFPEAGQGFGDRVLEQNFVQVENHFRDAAAKLPEGRIAELKYEDFADNTIEEVERVYSEIGLDFSDQYREILENYFALRVPYQRNRYDNTGADQKRQIYQKLKPLFERWGYSGK